MDSMQKLATTISSALAMADDPGCPPGLTTALTYAVLPGGHRIRPRLSLAVADACGNDAPDVASAAAASIEFLHCASLVHDDLPSFDNADMRRGKPAVHRVFGEQLALLAGDALIVLAFQVLARHCRKKPERMVELTDIIGGSVGVPRGIVAGQAWESEQRINLANYQQEKTGALFAAATMAGGAAAGWRRDDWRILGMCIGEAYQVADDIHDVFSTEEETGKPTQQDTANNRPNIVHEHGLEEAVRRLKNLVSEAIHSIPDCPGRDLLTAQITEESQRFLPEKLRRVA